MNRLFFDRSTGALGPQSFTRICSTSLLTRLQPALNLQLQDGPGDRICAHPEGVNTIAIDPLDSRWLLSGGAGASIKLWDLDNFNADVEDQILKPTATSLKSSLQFGITHVSFYPFDPAAFLSSSYDHTLKVCSTETLEVSASFDLDSIVYTHALSPIASHLLVATATQHPAIRLVDLRSGFAGHSLAGHSGAILSLAWSPIKEHILASGGTDGTVRLWDIRKSSGSLGLLDKEDAIGIGNLGAPSHSRASAKAHLAAVNGLTWTSDGNYIVSAGQDRHVRVWDAGTGANTLASFGPTLRNGQLSTLSLLVSPTGLMPPKKELLYYPNEHEILVFELHEGRVVNRLRVPGEHVAAVRSGAGERNVRNRITSMAWRGMSEGIYSGHADGNVRVWKPLIEAEDEPDYVRAEDAVEEEKRTKKRKALDDVFRDLTRQKITFG